MRRTRRRGGAAALAVAAAVVIIAACVFAVFQFDGGEEQPTPPVGKTAYGGGTPGPGDTASAAAPTPEDAQATPEQEVAAQRSVFTGSLEAGSAILVDGGGNVLYAKQAGEKRYPASTTKVLTALLVLENGKLDDVVRVGDEANMPQPGSSIAGLRYGEKLTVLQLLNAMLIPSGNDAAYVLAAYAARKVGGNADMGAADAVEAFVGMMNARAGELGAVNSHFTNPDGYQDERHYTTAQDMARIAEEAMTHREFREIVKTWQYRLPDVTVKNKDGKSRKESRPLENTNLLLEQGGPWYMGRCTGIKTGHTSDAGYCLVSSAASGGESVVSVVLGSTEGAVWRDASELLEWGLAPQ